MNSEKTGIGDSTEIEERDRIPTTKRDRYPRNYTKFREAIAP
ncbi:MAG: hypothetical protein AB1861_31110 [Cyanobacteriota bacterium]